MRKEFLAGCFGHCLKVEEMFLKCLFGFGDLLLNLLIRVEEGRDLRLSENGFCLDITRSLNGGCLEYLVIDFGIVVQGSMEN
jgi:hypothetical protein